MNLAHLPGGLVVREYQPDDEAACLEIYHSNEDTQPPGLLELYTNWLEMGTSYHLVIEHEGRVAASGGLEINGDKNSNGMIYGQVLRGRQRQGLGTLLTLTRLALVPGEHDPAFVGLETSVRNESFYQRFGFERLNKPVSRYAGASFFLDMGLWLPATQKAELQTVLQALPVDFQVDFTEDGSAAEEGEVAAE